MLETREYSFSKYADKLVETGSRPYSLNADAGYFGLLQYSESVDADSRLTSYVRNDFANSRYAAKQLELSGFCLFEILAPAILSSNLIDFCSVADVRLQEGFKPSLANMVEVQTPT